MGSNLKTRESIGAFFGMDAAKDLFDFPFVKERVFKIEYAFAKEYQVLPLQEDEKKIWVAVVEPFHWTSSMNFASFKKGDQARLYFQELFRTGPTAVLSSK